MAQPPTSISDPSRSSSEHDRSAAVIASIGLTMEQLESVSCRYQLKDEIARGGMGAVIRGRDPILNRDLAIKVLIGESKDCPQIIQRFLEEAQINGQLQHPGIVPVYELGKLEDSRPFFAMKLVKGKTLKQLLANRKSLDEEQSRFLGIFEQVCQTIAYAHSRKVIHRDLKPSNVMVGTFGEVQVMDWGVAKVLSSESKHDQVATPVTERITEIRTLRKLTSDGDGNQTVDGTVIGTPAYMPPEQAIGDLERVDKRADVFGLGGILCHILTGHPPFVADSREELFALSLRADLASALARLDDCDADPALIQLTKECLAAEPDKRPQTARVVAQRIADYFEFVQQRAKRIALEETRAIEEKKRQRVKFALAASVLVSLFVVGLAWLWLQNQRAELDRTKLIAAERELQRQSDLISFENREKNQALIAQARQKELAAEAERAKQQTMLTLSDAYVSRGIQAASRSDGGEAMMWFATAAELASADRTRQANNLLRANNWMRYSAVPVAAFNIDGRPSSLAFQPDGELLLARYKSKQYSFYDVIPATTRFQNLEGPDADWLGQLKLPDMQSVKHELRFSVYDWETGRSVSWLNPLNTGVADWSPDGTKIAIGRPNGKVEIRNVSDGSIIQLFDLKDEVHCVKFDSTGNRLAVAAEQVRIWHIEEQRLEDSVWRTDTVVHSMSFSPDDELLCVAGLDSVAFLFSVNSGESEPKLIIPHVDLFLYLLCDCKHCPVWLPKQNGEHRIAAICGRNEVAVWNVEAKQVETRFQARCTTIGRMSLNESNELAIAGDGGCEIRHGVYIDHVAHLPAEGFVTSVEFAKDRRLFLTGNLNSDSQIFELPSLDPVGFQMTHDSGVGAVEISDDQQWLATVTMNGLVRVWKSPRVSRHQHLDSWHMARQPEFSPDGRFVISSKAMDVYTDYSTKMDQVQVFQSENEEPWFEPISPIGKICDCCFLSDSRTLGITSVENGEGYITFYDLLYENAKRAEIKLTSDPVWVAVDPVQPRVAVIGHDKQLHMVDLEQAKIQFSYHCESLASVFSLMEFTHDGKFLVACSERKFEVINTETGIPVFDPVIYTHANKENFNMDVSPDGKVVAISSSDRAKFYSTETGEAVGGDLVHLQTSHYLGAIADIEFSPDSQFVLTGSLDGHARLWDWKTGEQVCPPMQHQGQVNSVCFTADGKYAVTGSSGLDCGPHVWDLQTGMRIMPSWSQGKDWKTIRFMELSPDNRKIVACGDQIGFPRCATVIFDLSEAFESATFSGEEYRFLGELTSSKRITLGRPDRLPQEQWMEQWQRSLHQNSRLCEQLKSGRVHR